MKHYPMECHILPACMMMVWCIFSACGNRSGYETAGIFEMTETLVTAELSGKVEKLEVREGHPVAKGQPVGYIDSTLLYMKKMQLLAVRKAMWACRPDCPNEADSTFNFRLNLINEKLRKCRIVNPADGTVARKYAQTKDRVIAGAPLYKIVDTRHLFLKVYLTPKQADKMTTGREVTVRLTLPDGSEKFCRGAVAWISDKAESLTQDEDHLLYAVKIAVDNTDGDIRAGMYGYVK
ncbi:MAG: HlyD family efflux transporter periplasmic adaptor subunit [Bacteroidales bacterium]|jgi:multidrug resistance efflux pump|nr:HlyD family efflux transporter periplasmic adaptor subunit [Bacteroidales bacterium]